MPPLPSARFRLAIRPAHRRSARIALVSALAGSLLLAARLRSDPPAQPAEPGAAAGTAARIHRVETGIPPISPCASGPPRQLDVEKLMQVCKVPGLSVAVIDGFKVDWAKGYGVAAPGAKSPVTVHTLFQAGSISKPVAAAGTLSLVERGKLALDENVNLRLKSWQVPDNQLTQRQKVTLRRILSHSAGLTVHGFRGYRVGRPLPTLVQVLDGKSPANSDPVRVDLEPGTRYRYSGGGVEIEQLLVVEATGQPFPQFMREAVLARIGMTESTYEQPLPPARAAFAATGTYGAGRPVPGRWHVYPEMAAAGLWTTPTDLARFAIEIALSKQSKANHVLSEGMTREMLTPQIDDAGLGIFVGGYGNPEEFGHVGSNEGFWATLIMFADSGKGVVILANCENDEEAAEKVANSLVKSIAREYGWNYTPR
jgi:CubicO group peptidase (beta-lactamase class C family)